MKRLEEAAKEYGAAMGENPMKPINASYAGLKAGFEFAQKGVDVCEELISKYETIIKNNKSYDKK